MRRTTTLTLTLALIFAGTAWAAEAEADKRKLDRGKSVIETPLERTVAGRKATPVLSPKKKIERPTERVVANSAATFENPKVQPGKVRWHADFAAAREAARVSGKPVLLFQMMGKLDERFC